MRSALALFVVVAACAEPSDPGRRRPIPSGGTPVGVVSGVPTGGGTPVGTTSDSGTTTPTYVGYPYTFYDCAAGVPPGPFTGRSLPGTHTDEDIELDLDGYLLVPSGDRIHRYTYDGNFQVLASGFGDATGMAMLPSGDLAFADRANSRVGRWLHATGGIELITANIPTPNGLEAGPDGSLYVTHNYSSVSWIDPNGVASLITSDASGSDGIAFNETWDALYVGSLFSGDLYRIPVYGPGNFGPIEIFAHGQNYPWGSVDGIQVDRCGNIYLASFGNGIWRLDPVTRDAELVVSADVAWAIPALRFGSGIGDFDALKLYASTYGELVEIDVGVPGKVKWPAVWP